MKSIVLIIGLFMGFGLQLVAQPKLFEDRPDATGSIVLSASDTIYAERMPRLHLPDSYRQKVLPYQVDNSKQPYFRPVFRQTDSECGQAASVAYCFTYEMDFLRGVSANSATNQYPTHFAYNFMNGGSGWHGVSYFHTFELLKYVGTPNVAEYGGLAEGGGTRWATGYEIYYNAMLNRLGEAYAIEVESPDKLLTLKHWLNDHLNGSDAGGLACFFANSPWNLRTLPEDTPEAGKNVIVTCSGPPMHSMAIVGYNDSIRYDYNGDGLYTNDEDINGDDTVTMQDWEIGGLKIVDVTDYVFNNPDSGFFYLMYNVLARTWQDGGIWNHVVHVQKPKQAYFPKLTAKIFMNYNRREKIKISVGVSGNPNDTLPEFAIDYPIFDYQGGMRPMQGPYTSEAENIEFGLDISPLLSSSDGTESLRFFLQVHEYDPHQEGSGKVYSFSVIDYVNNAVEYTCAENNVPIIHNGITRLSIQVPVIYEGLQITTGQLPYVESNEPYQTQLEANYGVPPYHWNLLMDYQPQIQQHDFPWVDAEKMEISDTINGTAVQELDFVFPFYDSLFTSVVAHTSGYILFEENQLPWPYLYDLELYMTANRMLTPFMLHDMVIDQNLGDGIWYEGDHESATFRWQTSHRNNPDLTSCNFAVTLYPDGNILFHFDSMNLLSDVEWWCGVSNGDDFNFNNFGFRDVIIPEHLTYSYPFNGLLHNIKLSDEGVLTAFVEEDKLVIPLQVRVRDADHMFDTRKLDLKTKYYNVEEKLNVAPASLHIHPNPFQDQTLITFQLKKLSVSKIEIYQLSGQKMATLFNGYLQQGVHELSWQGTSGSGHKLPPGVYLIRLQNSAFVISKKVIIIK